MKLAFTKMQGAGNDFVVIDGVTQAVDLNMGQVKRIALQPVFVVWIRHVLLFRVTHQN